jgi:hypothetical protein
MPGLTVALAGQAISIMASNMVEFAVSIWVFERTGSAAVLGGMTTAFTVPASHPRRGRDGGPLQPQVDDDDQRHHKGEHNEHHIS